MKRTRRPHRLRLLERDCYVAAKLYVDGNVVAETSFNPGTTVESNEAQEFVRSYFHEPDPNRKKKPETA